jgi:hypothetical protein
MQMLFDVDSRDRARRYRSFESGAGGLGACDADRSHLRHGKAVAPKQRYGSFVSDVPAILRF